VLTLARRHVLFHFARGPCSPSLGPLRAVGQFQRNIAYDCGIRVRVSLIIVVPVCAGVCVYVAIVLWCPLLAPLASRRLSLRPRSVAFRRNFWINWTPHEGRLHVSKPRQTTTHLSWQVGPGGHAPEALARIAPFIFPAAAHKTCVRFLAVCVSYLSIYIWAPAWYHWQHTVSRSKHDYATDQTQKCRLARSRTTTLFPTAHPWHSSLQVRSLLGASNASPSIYSPSLDKKSAGAGTMDYESRVWT